MSLQIYLAQALVTAAGTTLRHAEPLGERSQMVSPGVPVEYRD